MGMIHENVKNDYFLDLPHEPQPRDAFCILENILVMGVCLFWI
jgi:hypothetical protein